MEQTNNPNIQLNPVTLATAIYNFFVYGETVFAYRVVQVIASISLYVMAYKLFMAIYRHLAAGGTLECVVEGKTLDGGKCGEPLTLFGSVVAYAEAVKVATYLPVTAIVLSWFWRLLHNSIVLGAKSVANQKTKSLHGQPMTRGGSRSSEYDGGYSGEYTGGDKRH